MKCKKVIAGGLVLTFVMGISGCDSKKAPSVIDDLLDGYCDALNDLDADAVRDLSDWSKKDSDYKNIGELLDVHYAEERGGDKAAECVRYIASTIELNYDIDDLDIDGDKASIKAVYEFVDWESIYYVDGYESYDDVLRKLKSSKKTLTVKGKITFEKKKGEWKLCQLSKLNEVFTFTREIPYVLDPVIIETDPTVTTEPTEVTSGTSAVNVDMSDVIEAALYHLQQYESSIRAVQHTFGENACGVCDIDNDGIPELYYLSSDQVYEEQVFSADLYICKYLEYAGEYVRYIVVPGVIYQAADGGSYAIFTTGDELLITHSGGEEALYHIETEVYDLNWNRIAGYKRNVYYDYDPESDTDSYTYEYFINGKEITQEEYNTQMKDYINRTTLVIDKNYTPVTSDIEYPLLTKPTLGMIGYDESVKYVKSLQDNI